MEIRPPLDARLYILTLYMSMLYIDFSENKEYKYFSKVRRVHMGEAGHSFEAYYKRATSPLVVLRLLQDRTMYGYQISQAMKEKSGGKFTIAVLYPILYRLEEQGYIQVEKTEVTNNRARSYYAITEKGRQYLARSLDEYRVIHQAFMDIVEDYGE